MRQMFGKRVMMHTCYQYSKDRVLIFYLNIDVQVNVFFRTQTAKGIMRQTDVSSLVWTLLANQIARLVAIVFMSTGLSNWVSIVQITVQYRC